jgi:hypothetical protein
METVLRNASGIEANAFISTRDRLPRFGEWVRVIAGGDRCLGLLGPHKGGVMCTADALGQMLSFGNRWKATGGLIATTHHLDAQKEADHTS